MAAGQNMRGLWMWGCLVLALTPSLAWSQAELPAREAYLEGLRKYWNGPGGSMQGVFALARAAAREQLDAVIEWDKTLAAGKIPKKRFERRLPGFRVGTAKALYVIVDSRFFLELAQKRGDALDRKLFELLHETYNGSASRLYVDRITDVTACYHMGSREFIKLYRGWTQFKANHPRAYVETVNEELQAMEHTMLSATCACSSREVVDAGFEAFLKVFPKSPIGPQVRQRLERIHANTSGITFRCGQELNLGDPIPYGMEPPKPSP
ncbi:MAG TPA: hypothetical protein VNA24_32030 [Hyalangium sp.]|nr:hypothetical protein [Hyalangium sp.]